MKATLALLLFLICGPGYADSTPPMWTGRLRGMELVTCGHKHVTILLSDGRIGVIGVPILVEKPVARPQALHRESPDNRPAPVPSAVPGHSTSP